VKILSREEQAMLAALTDTRSELDGRIVPFWIALWTVPRSEPGTGMCIP
jgi:hypothetical protein